MAPLSIIKIFAAFFGVIVIVVFIFVGKIRLALLAVTAPEVKDRTAGGVAQDIEVIVVWIIA